MKKRCVFLFLVLILLFTSANLAQARDHQVSRVQLLYTNILTGAGAGTLVGLSASLVAYNSENSADPKLLITGPIYGFLGGALVGTGLGIYQFTSPGPSVYYPLTEYVTGGTLIGMMMGAMVATIAYARYDDMDFNAEIGWGGLIGAGLGLGLVFLEIGYQSGEGDMLLSGEIGLRPEIAGLPSLIPELKQEPFFCCRLVKINF